MTRDQASKEARKRWGAKSLIRAYEHISSPDRRADAINSYKEKETRRDTITNEIEERLKALDWYQVLIRERSALSKEMRDMEWRKDYFKFSVGHQFGIGFYIEGQGDTWEEAFAEADRKREAGK